MPIIKTPKTIKYTKFKTLLDHLPGNTVEIKKQLGEAGIVHRSMIHKAYEGTEKIASADKLQAVVIWLNEYYPRKDKSKIEIIELIEM
jgi:hypothetical protein